MNSGGAAMPTMCEICSQRAGGSEGWETGWRVMNGECCLCDDVRGDRGAPSLAEAAIKTANPFWTGQALRT